MTEIKTTIQPPNKSILDVIKSCAQQVSVIICTYLLGRFNFSILWVLVPTLMYLIDKTRKEKIRQKSDFIKDLTNIGEKQILATINDLPQWVFFPEFERTDWLNKITHQLWPYVNHYAKDLLTGFEDTLKQTLDGYQLKGFKFERIVLGSQPFRIEGVKVFPNGAKRDEIYMDLNVSYAGDCNITFHLAKLKAGIRNFQLYGKLRVVLKPLISSIPLVGGVQAYFMENPEIDFDLCGIAQVLDMPGMNDIIRKVILDTIGGMMVLPNKYFLKLSDEVSECAIVDLPKSALRVHVVEARDLLKKDIKILGKGKSDPYVRLRLGSQEVKSKVIDDTLNPQWDEWFEFKLLELSGHYLYIDLWDKDSTEDEFLGSCVIDIDTIIKNVEVDSWIQLEKVKHGMIHLRMTWLTLSTNYKDLQAALEETQLLRVTKLSSCLLSVVVDSASNLSPVRSNINPDPYAIVQLGKSQYETKVQEKTINPVWEENFTFFVINPNSDEINISIIDHKTDTNLGKLCFKVKNLGEKENLEILQRSFKMNTGVEIVLSMHLRIFKKFEPIVNVLDDLFEEEPKPLENHSRSPSIASLVPEKKNTFVKQDSTVSSNSLSNSVISEIEERLLITHPEGKFGRIRLTLRYSPPRQRLIIVVHNVENIPYKNPDDLPNMYVKIYLLPGRDKDSKRKTKIHKRTLVPVFDETFEYLISQGELSTKQIEISLVEDKVMKNPLLGKVIIDLKNFDSTTSLTDWFNFTHYKE
ncbi:unnamed protein product [Brassicogethes aeneus]|uniref:Uncharacterized protein n=1 Tax=Brassicogethes aeneus TaxID=1431903 RepID=A0A9P0FK95_BRAAE|nr:unnamed protein product [Brassicogethes aeneus]